MRVKKTDRKATKPKVTGSNPVGRALLIGHNPSWTLGSLRLWRSISQNPPKSPDPQNAWVLGVRPSRNYHADRDEQRVCGGSLGQNDRAAGLITARPSGSNPLVGSQMRKGLVLRLFGLRDPRGNNVAAIDLPRQVLFLCQAARREDAGPSRSSDRISTSSAEHEGTADGKQGARDGSGNINPVTREVTTDESRPERAGRVHRNPAHRRCPEPCERDVAADTEGRDRTRSGQLKQRARRSASPGAERPIPAPPRGRSIPR